MTDGALAAKGGRGGQVSYCSAPSSRIPVAPTGQGLAGHSEDHGGVNATYNPLGFLSWGHGYLLGAAVGLPVA